MTRVTSDTTEGARGVFAANLLEWADNGADGVVLIGSLFVITGIAGVTPLEVVENINVYEPWRMLRIAHNVHRNRVDACVVAMADDPDDDDMFDIEVFGTEALTIRVYAWRNKCRAETVLRFFRTVRDLYGGDAHLRTGEGEVLE